MRGEGTIPSPESVRIALANILSSTPFNAAARSRRFLSFVTEKTLAGEQATIKEMALGLDVFDRASDFDPRIDTMVRVEAGKLRKRLEEYYKTEGVGDPLRIEIPKGSYVPRFFETAATETASAPSSPRVRRDKLNFAALAGVVVAALGVGAYFYPRAAVLPAEPSVAVLPFLNFSADNANEYFADGLTEDLTDALARLGGLRVASRTSAFLFKGKQVDIRLAAGKLGAAFVVEGSVRKEGLRMKITAQLIRASDGYHIWSNSFERDVHDVFAVQREIAQAIAAALEQKLTGANRQQLAHSYTANLEAFDLYMRGRHAASTGFLAEIDVPEKLQRAAIAADPSYPLPLIALADLYLRADILGLRPSEELYPNAKAAVTKALSLDGGIAEAHTILGRLTARHEYDWASAERYLRDALALDSHSAAAHNALAQDVFAPQGRWQEAVSENRKALELDPFSTTIALGEPWLAYLQRHYDLALQGFQHRAAISPADPILPFSIATALIAKGDFAGALKILEARKRDSPPLMLSVLAYAHAQAGHATEARKILAQILAAPQTRFVSSGPLMMVYMGLNDNDRTFACLERARANHESFLIFARVDPLMDPIRQDPRFRRFLSTLGLDDESVAKNQAVGKRIQR